MPQLYKELRKLASYRMKQEQAGQTLSGTALVHEAYLRLSKESDGPRWANRKQFFSAVSEAMRRIMIDRFRAKKSLKRGVGFEHVELDESEVGELSSTGRLLAVNEALDELAAVDPDLADLVMLRFFVGFTLEEVAEIQGSSVSTLTRQWAFARGWLAARLDPDSGTSSD